MTSHIEDIERRPDIEICADELRRARDLLEAANGQIERLTTEVGDMRYQIRQFSRAAKITNAQRRRLLEIIDSASGSPTPPTCEWFDDDDGWHSSCGKDWEFTYDGPTENGLDFCMKCGKPVVVETADSTPSPVADGQKLTAKLCRCESECEGHFSCRIVWNKEAIERETNLRHPGDSDGEGLT